MNERPRGASQAPSRTRGTAPSVRPNMFRSQLTRRPTASSSNSAETVRLDVETVSGDSDIVVRDQHGEVEIGDPPTPIIEDDDEDEVVEDDHQETEKERQRLAEAVKHHRINHTAVPEQPEELLEAVRASLRAKVTALAEDNWMFEPEDQSRSS